MTSEESEEKRNRNERRTIMKNIVIIGIAFMLQFTAYCGAANLQSSINSAAGLGTVSLAAVYASVVISNLLLPTAVIRWLGIKWAICFSLMMYMPYIAAQMYPTFYTLIPAAVLVGIGSGPLWCAKATYLAIAAENQSKFSKTTAKKLLVRFLGLFFMIFQSNQIWGNLISSLVLSSGNNTAATTDVNESMVPILCGANFLQDSNEITEFHPQPSEKIRMIAGIYLTCMAGAALLIAVGVNNVNSKAESSSTRDRQSRFSLLIETLKQCKKTTQQLLIIITIFMGLQSAFFIADFTASFVSCAIGPGSVGFVMMMFGLSDAIGSFITGYFSKVFGRLPLIIGTLLIHGGLLITLLIWQPQAGSYVVPMLIAVLWGLCDSVWLVQITGYYGLLFAGSEEAAFASCRLWESLGCIVTYVLSPRLRTRYKIYILMTMMGVGAFGYFAVEFQQYKMKRNVVVEKQEAVRMINTEQSEKQ